MKKLIFLIVASSLITLSCLPPPGHPRGGRISIAPPLPATVVLIDPYYYYRDYYYYYDNGIWYYSRSRDGDWRALPRDHYPRNIKFKHRGRGRGRGHGPRGYWNDRGDWENGPGWDRRRDWRDDDDRY